MPASWEHADIFPVVARIIRQLSASTGDFVTHDEITVGLLTDPGSAGLIASARAQLEEAQTEKWIAHNMVAWFSQRITVGESDWAEGLDRKKIGGKWACRPKTSQAD
jgi:hypothetical protein